MAASECGLDRGLARAEPVERAIEVALVDRAELEQPAQAGTGGIGLPSSRSRPIARIVPSTAAAWPCGSARRMRIPSAATATPPFSRVRNPSTSAGAGADHAFFAARLAVGGGWNPSNNSVSV